MKMLQQSGKLILEIIQLTKDLVPLRLQKKKGGMEWGERPMISTNVHFLLCGNSPNT